MKIPCFALFYKVVVFCYPRRGVVAAPENTKRASVESFHRPVRSGRGRIGTPANSVPRVSGAVISDMMTSRTMVAKQMELIMLTLRFPRVMTRVILLWATTLIFIPRELF